MSQLEKGVMFFLFGFVPVLLVIPIYIVNFMLMWMNHQLLLMFISAYFLVCWAVLSAKLLKSRKDALLELLILHIVPLCMAAMGGLAASAPKYEVLYMISTAYFQAIWPLMVLCATKVDARVTVYYSGTAWTVYAIGFVMMLLAGAIGIGIKSRLLGNEGREQE